MKVEPKKQWDRMAEIYYKAGIERCLQEMAQRRIVLLDKNTRRTEVNELTIDMSNPEVIHTLVNRIARREDYESGQNTGQNSEY